MTDKLIPDAEIPKHVEAQGRRWLVIDRMQNFHYRALLLPIGGDAPRWFSNDELRAALAKKQEPVAWRAYNRAQSCWEYGERDDLTGQWLEPPVPLYVAPPAALAEALRSNDDSQPTEARAR